MKRVPEAAIFDMPKSKRVEIKFCPFCGGDKLTCPSEWLAQCDACRIQFGVDGRQLRKAVKREA